MASRLIKLQDGTLIEVDVSEDRAREIAFQAATIVGNSTFETIKPLIVKACKPIVEVWSELGKDYSIEEAELELGLAFEAEGNLYITKAKGNANLKIKLKMKPSMSKA